ncbi:MAG: cobalamin-binding protein [Candidatus Bathyarchaeia archaeon]|nr:cobalamin-binding protein [Candidatus Bathyarchaeia archaeon]
MKYLIAAVVVIVLIASAAFIYVYYQGQPSGEELEALQNLVDDHGYKTSLTAYPDKIISVAPSCTEILYAIGAGDKVVGVTTYDDYPYDFAAWIASGNMSSVGDFTSPNMEVIISLDPDLILASGGVQEESVNTLRERGYKVLVLDPTSVDGILENIELVGNATGKQSEASALVNNLTSRINAVAEKVANATKPKVYYETYYEITSSWTIGGLAWQSELIEKAGGTNIFGDQQMDYYQYQVEALIARNPDVIVLPAEGMGTGTQASLDAVKARPGWDTMNAVQNDRIYQINPNIIERAGPRVVDAIEQMAEFFHPELF